MKYEVYKVDPLVTPNGKKLKKLVIQGEGKQYPDKNVTMWSNHPLYESIAPGQTVDIELEIEDSKTPNPHGGFYKNKTVIFGKPVTSSPPGEQEERDSVSQVTLNEILKIVRRLEGALIAPKPPVPSDEDYQFPEN